MDGRASAYGDMFADVYDEWFADVSDGEAAAAFVGALARELGGAVLELGIGTGRVALPIARDGVETWGVDASMAMVARLRAKSGGDDVRIVLADMGAVPFVARPRFAVVFVAYNTIFNLTAPGAQLRALETASGLLTRHGRLVVEAFVPAPDAPEGAALALRTARADSVVLSVSHHDRATRSIEGTYVELTDGRAIARPWAVRYCTPAELDVLAATAGLRLVDRHGGWRGEPFDDSCAAHVSVYARDV